MRRDIFQAIADPIRREILNTISTQNLTVGEIASHFDISRQAVSKQLKILNECGLMNVYQKGRERYYSINPKSLTPAYLWIEQLQNQWEDRIGAFEQYITELKNKRDDKQ